MNELLQIKLPFGHIARKGKIGFASLPANQNIKSDKLQKLADQLKKLDEFWKNQNVIQQALVSIEYTRVVAKSNRIRQLFTYKVKDINDCVKGAKFAGDDSHKYHIITYCIPKESLRHSESDLRAVIQIINESYNGQVDDKTIESINKLRSAEWPHSTVKKSTFVNLIVDCFYIDNIKIPTPEDHTKGSNIVTIYNTNFDVILKMNELGISLSTNDKLDDNTIRLTDKQYDMLYDKASFLIAMSLKDITQIPPMHFEEGVFKPFSISKPSNEPTIGVIDTFFEKSVYFSDWVEVHDEIPAIGIIDADRFHGTAVDSIIVDGARINPELDDGCGNFRVRHFSTMTSKGYSSIALINSIKRIVQENTDIKVWNISLGANYETHPNYLSYEAAELDKLQNEYDVIFVIAGTNDPKCTMTKRIGSPADSINSLVVNAVNSNKESASYSRRGPVLSFYNKPDISYYGGDKDKYIKVCSKNGEQNVLGTSFAAPFVSRKLAYLIHIMGLSREVAKALMIDSTIGWHSNTNNNVSDFIGMGVVPIHIKDILQTDDDEIRFVLTGDASDYDNYSYNIPVPISNGKQPYVAKATLCYFPKGFRNQGVDYTCTELDLHFGRIIDKKIQTINNNLQNTDVSREYEKDARSYHRKWDNTKVICETLKQRGKPKTVYQKGFWGISIKKTERNSNNKHNVHFGMVVTLKNINGENLIQDFIQQCAWNNILVQQLKVEHTINLYNKLSEDIILE